MAGDLGLFSHPATGHVEACVQASRASRSLSLSLMCRGIEGLCVGMYRHVMRQGRGLAHVAAVLPQPH